MNDAVQGYLEEIHNITSSSELFEKIGSAIQELLPVIYFQIYFLDESTNTLNLYFSSLESNSEVTNQTTQMLESNLLKSDQDVSFETNKDSDLIGCGKLVFQGSLYGCLTIHGTPTTVTEEHKAIFKSILRATNPEIIKIQLLESANQVAHLSLSKLNGIHASIDLIRNLELDSILIKLMDVALKTMNAEVGSIMIIENKELITKVDFGFTHDVATSLKTKQGATYLSSVLDSTEATLILNSTESDLLDIGSLSVRLTSIISVPLRINQDPLGILHIINYEEKFDQNAFEVLKTICNLSSYSLQNAILHKAQMDATRLKESMQIAQDIQSALLVKPNLNSHGLEVYGWNLACDETGGDYYDVFIRNDTSLEVIVGDASGHGLGAAMTMIITRASLKTLYQQNLPKPEMIGLLNYRLAADTSDERFMTLFCGSIDIETKTLTYISAGHDGPLLCRQNELPLELESTGIPLGMIDSFPYDEIKEVPLKIGDFVLLGSDGTWEAMNDQNVPYGKTKMTEIIQKNSLKSTREIIELIQTDILKHIGKSKIRDDMTLILIRVNS